MKLKRIIALIFVFAFALPCLNVSALFSYAKNSDDPFASFDLKREKAINEALSDYDGTKQKNSAELISSMSSVPDVKRVVKFKEEAGLDIIYDAVNGIGFELLANSSERAFSLYFTNEAEADYFRTEYESIIKSFEKDKYKRISAVTLNDELSSNYWAYDSSFAYEAWEYGFGSRDVIIAVLDSGIFRNHEDFDNTYIMDGYDAVTKKTGVNSDELGHGTKVTGIIAASPNNGKGISGIAPGCSILPINIVSDNQTVSSSDFASAVYFAVDSGAKIINLSIGGYDYVDIEAEAVKYANSKGCIVVSSSGNEGDKYQAGAYSYPASYDGVISVGACDGSGNICLFSQFNDKVTLAAPGTDLITLNRFNAYSYGIAGTSFSCAFVTGAAGLLLSKLGERRDVNGAMFKKLIETVSKTNYNIRAGWGILDIQARLEFTEKAAVIGVKDGEIYFGNVSIWFINGSAVLDGKSIASGTLCKYSGKHNLELTFGEEKISVGFTTDNVPLSFDYKESSDGARIRFSRGKATLDGFPYSSGELVSRSGTHLFRITGPNGNTREYSFTLDFTAPEIAGVQDGRFYLGPRCISFAGAGKVTLNGNEIESGYVVSAPGEYRLVSSAKNGNDKKTVSFEIINDDKVKNYTLPAGINRIYVSEKNGIAVLYGDTVRTVYIYNISDMKTAKKILKLKGNVLECFEYGGKLAAVHESSISTFDIAELTVPGTPVLTEIRNEHQIETCTSNNGKLYYIEKGNGEHRNIYEYSFDSGLNRKITTVDAKVGSICYDETGDILVTAVKSGEDPDDFPYDNTVISFSADTGDLYTESYPDYLYGGRLISYNGNVFIGSNIISARTHGLVLQTSTEYDSPVCVFDGIILTEKHAIDISTGKILGINASDVYDAAFSSGVVYTVSSKGLTVSESAIYAEMTDASPLETPYSRDDYRKELQLESEHTSWAIDGNEKLAYCVDDKKNMLDVIDIRTLAYVERIPLRFLPEKVVYSDGTVIVMFGGTSELYIYDELTKKSRYVSYPTLNGIEDIGADGEKLFLLSDGEVYTDSTGADGGMPVRILSGDLFDEMTVVPQTHGLYLVERMQYMLSSEISLYDTVTFDKKESAVTGQLVHKLIYDGDILLTDNAAFRADTLEMVMTFDSAVKAKRGDCIVTSAGIVSIQTGGMICSYDFSSPLVYMDDKYNCVTETEGRLCRISCDPSATPLSVPEVNGADNGRNYDGNTTVVFNTGAAYLDGTRINSGRFINDGGSHSLTLVLPYNRTFTYSFAIDAKLERISVRNGDIDLTETEQTTVEVEFYPKGSPTTEVKYTSSDPSVAKVENDGTVTAMNRGRAVITASVYDGKYTSGITVTVTELKISFKTDAFAYDSGLIKGITPGITVSGIVGALTKECSACASVYDKNGVEVKSGAVMTGMTLALCNANGDKINSAVLCVAGDTDGDGSVTVRDYASIKRIISDPDGFSTYEQIAADINNDGKVDVLDALRAENHILGRQPISMYNGVFKRSEEIKTEISVSDIIPGRDFAVRISLSGGQLYGVSARIIFDSSLFSFRRAVISDVSWKYETASKTGEIYFMTYDASGNGVTDADGMTVASLIFRASSDAPAGIVSDFELSSVIVITPDGAVSSADKNADVSVSDGSGVSAPTSAADPPSLKSLTAEKGTLLPEFDSGIYDYVLFLPPEADSVYFECEAADPETEIIKKIPEVLEMTSGCEIICIRGDLQTVYNVTVRKNVNLEGTEKTPALKITFIILLFISAVAVVCLIWSYIVYKKRHVLKNDGFYGGTDTVSGSEKTDEDGNKNDEEIKDGNKE